MTRLLPIFLALVAIATLVTACDEADDSGASPDSGPSGQAGQFCSDLDTLNLYIIQMQALNVQTIAGANEGVLTSYDAVRQESLEVPQVNMGPLTDAFNAYTAAVQAVLAQPPGSQNVATLTVPLNNLKSATASTAAQIKCPPLATPMPTTPTPTRPAP